MIVRNHIIPIFDTMMESKTKIRSVYMAKRVSNVVVFISNAIIIASIITIISVINYDYFKYFKIPAMMGRDYLNIVEWKRNCVKLVLFSMIIPSVSCIVILIPIEFILTHRLQILEATYIKKEYGYSEDTFKLYRYSRS